MFKWGLDWSVTQCCGPPWIKEETPSECHLCGKWTSVCLCLIPSTRRQAAAVCDLLIYKKDVLSD